MLYLVSTIRSRRRGNPKERSRKSLLFRLPSGHEIQLSLNQSDRFRTDISHQCSQQFQDSSNPDRPRLHCSATGMRTRVCGRSTSASVLSALGPSVLSLGRMTCSAYELDAGFPHCERDLPEAILIARSTLCQFDRTAATATHA